LTVRVKRVTHNQDFIFHVRALFKKQTKKYSHKKSNKVEAVNVKILEM